MRIKLATYHSYLAPSAKEKGMWFKVVHHTKSNVSDEIDCWCIDPKTNRVYLVQSYKIAEIDYENEKEMTMDKQAALARLGALEQEAAALREILSKPDSLLPVELGTVGSRAQVAFGGEFAGSNDLSGYLAAFRTMIDLRAQPGTVKPNDNWQYVLRPTASLSVPNTTLVEVVRRKDKFSKMNYLSPCFGTENAAMLAINKVGSNRIIAMFKTLSHSEI